MKKDEEIIYNYLLETFDVVNHLDLSELSSKILNYKFNMDKDYKIIIYGAGNIGKITYKKLLKNGYFVECFLDQNAETIKSIGSKNVYIPEKFILEDDCKEYIIFIAVLMSEQDKNELLHYLKRLGYENIIFDYSYLLSFNECIVRDLPLININSKKKEIISAFNYLEDIESKKVFAKNLRARATLNFNDVFYNEDTVQYFKVNVDFKQGFKYFVDCGAYIGDTLEQLLRYYTCNSYIGFEPDRSNYNILKNRVQEHRSDIENVNIYPFATSNTDGVESFSTIGNGMSSTIDENGVNKVKTVRLDDLLFKEKITMIKMDIEGSEIETIRGAIKIIKEQKPDMEICLYHKISDFWEIPILIKNILPEYKLYLRCHSKILTMETVLYVTC